ncbi:high mobility group nucleosome-binding domain-containing protein 5-like [Asparagus officinalis]|uniref:high mobility group nucleosome-binding domain-containing protein 5-like n=1 Tax=Asparagus officinalis TaxID=4686 RepID=UPI00098E15EE|nr:high mobility group nucleosome-binding domain-containing protein 5-like [Asparagus officinalis]
MADSDSSVSKMEGSISSGEVWSTLSEDWEISSEETDPEEMFGERVDYSLIGHHTRGRLAKREEEDDPEEDPIEEDPKEEDPIEEDPEEEDPIEEDPEEEDLIEEDPKEEDPEEDPEDPMDDEEPMEWEFEVAPEPLLGEILEGVPLGWELDLDEEDWAWEDEPMMENPAEDDEQEEISLDGSEPQPTEASDTESTSSSPSTSS